MRLEILFFLAAFFFVLVDTKGLYSWYLYTPVIDMYIIHFYSTERSYSDVSKIAVE